MNKLLIGYLYKDELNLYGDNGNVEVLSARCARRDIECEIVLISKGNLSAYARLSEINLLFMGGGPDSSQKSIYGDFLEEKEPFIRDYIASGKTGLFVCGSYQLMGDYYRAADGAELKGLGLFKAHTIHFGKNRPRCIGNVRAKINSKLSSDQVFKNVDFLGGAVIGFENHGGRTYLDAGAEPFAHVTYGHGNNSEDGTEGIIVGNCIGTYFHGPVLAKNPHLADYLIAKSLNLPELPKLNAGLTVASYTASKKLR